MLDRRGGRYERCFEEHYVCLDMSKIFVFGWSIWKDYFK